MRRLHSTAPSLRRLVMAGALAATLAAIGTAPAFADDWHHGRDRFAHERFRHEQFRRHEWRERDGFAAPRYYYAPPYYYPPSYAYVPPPVVYPPAFVAPGLNFGFYFR